MGFFCGNTALPVHNSYATMACARPLVSANDAKGVASGSSITLPAVFKAPVRQDLVNRIYSEVRKNNRMPHGVSEKAGHQTSAESWGTGRAVARIPRVRGGGTHRSGQGAFGNMCRGGHMFGAKKVWRRIHRKVNVREKRYAVVSAIAASGSPALVMSKGHQINRIREVPLVVEDKLESVKKTKEAVAFLKKHKAWPDVVRVYKSRTNRAGKGKRRNRRKVHRKGPLVIYNKNEGLTLAFRNIPGVDTICVDKLNILKLAPGGRVGRFCIWTEGAIKMLDKLYGTWHKKSELKANYNLPQPIVASADLMQILKDENIRKHLKAPKLRRTLSKIKLNPLNNEKQLLRLNPYAAVEKNLARKIQAIGLAKRGEKVKRLAISAKLKNRKEKSLLANAALKSQARKEAIAKRHAKAYKTMKKFMEKNRKPRKPEDEKTERSEADLKAFREKKALQYKKQAVEARGKAKKTKGKKEKKAAFKARKALKVKNAAKSLDSRMANMPEVKAERARKRKEAADAKAKHHRKVSMHIKKCYEARKAK